MGRPSKLTPPVWKAIVTALERGSTETAAADLVDIYPTTISDWKAKNPKFAEDVARARARYDERLLKIVRNVAEDPEHKQSAAMATWLLSKRNPRLYGTHTTVAGDPTAPIGVEVTTADAKALAKRFEAMSIDELAALVAKGDA